jgi:phospholipid/cholesterol/gamma-HCH transport system substrate-binding protein
MRQSPTRELWVGLFVLAGLAGIAWLSFSVGGIESLGRGGMKLIATFDEIGSLKRRAQVVVAGVKVGQVDSIRLGDDFRARVTLDVDPTLKLPDDTSASIMTAGLLGDQYIALEPGGDTQILHSGDQIQFTQSAVILERLIGKLIQNIGGGSKP